MLNAAGRPSAGRRWLGSLPPQPAGGGGGGGRFEVPVLSMISLTTCLWLASLDQRSWRRRGDASSLRHFVDNYLRKDRVDEMFVLGGNVVEAHTRKFSDSSFSKFLFGPYPSSLATNSIVRFRLDNNSKEYLECLVKALHLRNPPPVYYPSFRSSKIWQRRFLLGSLLAATFSSVAYKFPSSKAVSSSENNPIVPSARAHTRASETGRKSTFENHTEKLMKFGQVQSQRHIPDVRFSDIAGLDQAKLEILEFVDFLKNPEKFQNFGAKVPRGALLVGPPGTGKTLLAKAVAGEANVPFFSTSGSDFIEMFVGVGSSRIRDLFEKARQAAPSIVFIDEIDTIGRNRSSSSHMGNGGTDERESTLNALLVELDGFNSNSNVVTLAGTNRGDVLDRALTRPGRFDRCITLSKPSISERMAIFDIHLRPIKLDPILPKKNLSQRLAALTPGFSGAEISNVCNEGAILAARRGACAVGLIDFETAVERLIGGLKCTGDVLNVKLQKQVAIHEAGHAICGWFLKEADPVLKLSIVPRSNGALGYTQMLPDDVRLSTKEALEDRIAVLLGGRAAEYLYCQTLTTGASDDLERATRLCRAYVCKFGFDEIIGLRNYSSEESRSGVYNNSPLGLVVGDQIEERVDILLKCQWERALDLLSTKKTEIERISKMLIEKEVISYRDLEGVLGELRKGLSKRTKEFIDALPKVG